MYSTYNPGLVTGSLALTGHNRPLLILVILIARLVVRHTAAKLRVPGPHGSCELPETIAEFDRILELNLATSQQ